jgi:hypothetical protein
MAATDDEEEGTTTTTTTTTKCYGLGRPLLLHRNWAAYSQAREGPLTRFYRFYDQDPAGSAAEASVKLLQRWQPDLMLDSESTLELVKEHL